MRKLASFSARETGVDRRTKHQSEFAAGLIGWIRRHRLGACIGILIAAAAAIAQQAYEGQTEWFDSVEQDVSETVTQVAGLPSLPDQTRVDLMVGQPAHDATVGKVAGEAGVSGGAATYAIPIVVPPGRRGMQPELSLSYSSRVGNGIAGMGWSLSGLSSLHRCPSTLEQDGIIRPVMLDASDKLCLDGQRLVARAGVAYGNSGATYATEIDSFARITQLSGGLASTAAHFKVELKSGEILYYGGNPSDADASATVVAGGVSLPTSWLLERKQDRLGNLVRYEYANYGNGEVLPLAVYYTGFNSTDGNRKVEFTYAARPIGAGANDSSSSYLAGGLTLQTQRLTYVTTKVGTQAVRQYRLAYQTSAASRRSLLASVTECAYVGAAATCRRPTTFAWQAGPPAYQFKTVALGAGPGSAALALDRSPDLQPLGDFDGDGRTEVLWSQMAADNVNDEKFIVSLSSLSDVRWAMPIPAGAGVAMFKDAVTDYDLDGKADFLGIDASGNYKIWFWHGPATATTFATAFTESWNTGLHFSTGSSPTNILVHAGDMDADGRADLVLRDFNSSGGSSCTSRVKVHRNVAGAGGTATFPFLIDFCLSSVNHGTAAPFYQTVPRVSDFDGDGLPDFWVKAHGYGGAKGYDRIVFGRKTGGTYALAPVAIDTLFPSAPEQRQPDEFNAGDTEHAMEMLMDINGDGLDDLIYRRDAQWRGRLNRGGKFGARIVFEDTSGRNACAWQQGQCESFTQPFDYDSDGRTDLLIPVSFAARVCNYMGANPNDPNSPDFFRCPENPVNEDALELGLQARFMNGFAGPVQGMYSEGVGWIDRSKYYSHALRFVQTGPNQFRIDQTATSIILSKTNRAQDLTGDGLIDRPVVNNCSVAATSALALCYIPRRDVNHVDYPASVSPQTFPDGSSVIANLIFSNENRGAGALNPDNATPQTPDMLSMVTDGMGVETVWTYYTLSSKAGRTAGETPLYTVPMDETSRYIDDRHFYFTSSMPVVSDMIQSDGRGDYRSWRYGYSEAMYHARGRGFQGFRTIIEEDEAAGTRTTTTFHQKFPLTSQPESIVVNSLNRSGTSAPISEQLFTWRCNLANRNDAAACAPPSGAATVKFPYLDTQETLNYDAATADNPAGGTPLLVSSRKQVAADDATCADTFAAASGYDAYGNLRASTTITSDGTGTGGYRKFVASHCVRNLASFAAVDTANWWLDRLNSRTASTKIAYDGTNHTGPTGMSNPVQTVTTGYAWNTNRTLFTETVQAGIANQQRVTTYGYPASNYGLPDSVSVAASGDPNGTRTVTTTYSTDGYFPETVKNPLLHQVTTVTRAADGQPTSVTDANQLRTEFFYDAFGLPVRTRFLGSSGQTAAPDRHVIMAWCSAGGCTANGLFLARNVQDGTPVTSTVFDQLGRPLRQRTRLMDDTDALVDTQYDAAGRVALQSQPYRAGFTNYWTQFPGYDVLGRVTHKITAQANHDGRGDLVTRYTYSGRQTQIQACGSLDPDATRCLTLSRTTDSLGRHVETVDANGGVTKFWYDGSGNALAIRDAQSNAILATYNALGQRTAVDDPNQGAWSFGYNALGELRTETDARNITTSTLYDKLGRPTQRSASYEYDAAAGADIVRDVWSYDAPYGKGLAANNERFINATSVRREVATYDPLSRPIERAITQYIASGGSLSLTQETAYDAYYGRPKGQSYGNGEALWLRYNKYGQLVRESDANTGADYRLVNETDARGNPTRETLAGGNLGAVRTYQPQTGQVASIRYGNLGNAYLRQLNYTYDVFGNLAEQVLDAGLSAETYRYDALHRLTNATRQGAAAGDGSGATVTYGYDAVGNFQYKSDFSRTNKLGWYDYIPRGAGCGGGPNAVKRVTLIDGSTRSYCYDANGNMTGDDAGLALTYDHTQRPIKITRGAVVQHFDYGPDGMRFRRYGSEGETQYFPGIERFVNSQGIEKTYLGSSVLVNTTGSTRRVDYLLTDRLGSVDAIADGNGTLVETRGYDAFGKPRTGTWTNTSPPRIGATATTNTPRGFTGHEHLDGLELIHMNGRVYDYSVGRFTGVDPVIQFPLNSQSLNPYSYIMNNPLAATDPTGYATCQLDDKKSCAEAAGTHTITDSKGNNLGTLTVGKSSVSFSANFSGIATSLRTNGAERGAVGQIALASLKEGVGTIGKRVESVLPGTGQAMQRGELGTLESNKEGFGLGLADPVVRFYNASQRPLFMLGIGAPLPEVQYEDNQLFGAAAVEVAGLLATRGVGAEVTGLRVAARGVSSGEAGRFANLEARAVSGDALTPHHMPQAAAGFTSRADGGALVLPHDVHKMTRTYGARGARTAREEAGMPFRQVMARDIRDVRGLTGSTYNRGMFNLLQYYRQTAPELMRKP